MELTTVRRRDRVYPSLLAQLHDPPRELYVRGRPELLGEPAVAVVGARSCSAYGAQVARMLGRELASAGLVVVSGLARGIDGEAHRGALEAGGATVAVLGCGIDRDYPRAHAGLAERIRGSGAVVSEYPPGTEPAPWRFPARNRNSRGAMRGWLNHAVCPCRFCRRMPPRCGPGVVRLEHSVCVFSFQLPFRVHPLLEPIVTSMS
jgi:DNA processing protein